MCVEVADARGVCVGVWLIVYVGGWCTHGSRCGVARIWLGWGLSGWAGLCALCSIHNQLYINNIISHSIHGIIRV